MANWAEGTLKIRGKQENLKKFIKEGLGAVYQQTIDFESKYDDSVWILKNNGGFYIDTTRRAFIEQNVLEIWFENDDNKQVIEFLNFKQAWGVLGSEFLEIAKKYDIDIHIFAYEKGMEFTQEVEIVNGKMLKNAEQQYNDYYWDVPFSSLGG